MKAKILAIVATSLFSLSALALTGASCCQSGAKCSPGSCGASCGQGQSCCPGDCGSHK